MAALEPAVDQDEKFFDRLGEIAWIDDVTAYKCTRCQKILVQHYISNCEHKFCNNCKRVVDDGSQRWRCPSCNEFIREIGRQDFKFRDRVFELKLHCPNRKYGCEHICPFKALREHLDRCEHTRERALPKPYEGKLLPETLVTINQLKREMQEMKQKMIEMEKLCMNRDVNAEQKGVNESAWELSVEVNKMNRVMEKKQNDGLIEMRSKLFLINNRVDGVKSDQERTMNELSEMKKNWAETIFKVDGVIHAFKEEEITRKEVKSNVNNNSSQINNLNGKQSQCRNDLREEISKRKTQVKNVKSEIDKKMTDITMTLNEKTNKTEVETFKITIRQTCRGELNRKMLFLLVLITASMIPALCIIFEKKMPQWNINKLKTMEENGSLYNKNLEQKVFNLETYNQIRYPEINSFLLAENKSNFQPDFTWKINGIENKVKKIPFEIKSEVFEWTGYPIQAQAKMEVKSDEIVYVSLCLLKNENDKDIDIKLIPSVHYVLRDQSGNGDAKHRSSVLNYLFTTTFKYELTFEKAFVKKFWLTEPTYNLDDSIVIDIYIEPSTITRMVYSYDGTLNWAIDHYRKRKMMAKEWLVGHHESPYFYTSPSGYRVQVGMWLDGFGEYKGKGLTMEIDFISGEFDADLPLSFPHQTTVTFFNRKEPHRSITKTVQKNIRKGQNYFIDVCSDEEVENVIKMDTILYKVTIKYMYSN